MSLEIPSSKHDPRPKGNITPRMWTFVSFTALPSRWSDTLVHPVCMSLLKIYNFIKIKCVYQYTPESKILFFIPYFKLFRNILEDLLFSFLFRGTIFLRIRHLPLHDPTVSSQDPPPLPRSQSYLYPETVHIQTSFLPAIYLLVKPGKLMSRPSITSKGPPSYCSCFLPSGLDKSPARDPTRLSVYGRT